MTIPLHITPIWAGETVAVLGNAPSLPDELATLSRPIRAIAANRAVLAAPWADMMVSIDANWPDEAADYTGARIIGFESDLIDAYYMPLPHEQVTVAPGHILHLRSNLLAAIRIAEQAGAARILLLGIDMDRYEAMHDAPGVAAGLAALIQELAARGVVVEYYQPPAAETAGPDEAAEPET